MRAELEEISGYVLNKMFSEGSGQVFSFSRPLYIMDTRILVYFVAVFTQVCMLEYAFLCLLVSRTFISMFRLYRKQICHKKDILYKGRTEKL